MLVVIDVNVAIKYVVGLAHNVWGGGFGLFPNHDAKLILFAGSTKEISLKDANEFHFLPKKICEKVLTKVLKMKPSR